MKIRVIRWLSNAILLSILAGLSTQPVLANTYITSGKVYQLASQVYLRKKAEKKFQTAKVNDGITPNDILKTGSNAWAKLLFNEGTLFWVQANAEFFFLDKTRSFKLKHGVVLSMIQPGQGMTTVITPTANIIVLGTALVVRHDATQNTTLITALTEKPGRPIFVTKTNGQGRIKLKAGEQVKIKNNVVGAVEPFNLLAFYQVCSMSSVLAPEQEQLMAKEPPEAQTPLLAIREETAKAVAEQSANAPPSTTELAELCASVPELPRKRTRDKPKFIPIPIPIPFCPPFCSNDRPPTGEQRIR